MRLRCSFGHEGGRFIVALRPPWDVRLTDNGKIEGPDQEYGKPPRVRRIIAGTNPLYDSSIGVPFNVATGSSYFSGVWAGALLRKGHDLVIEGVAGKGKVSIAFDAVEVK